VPGQFSRSAAASHFPIGGRYVFVRVSDSVLFLSGMCPFSLVAARLLVLRSGVHAVVTVQPSSYRPLYPHACVSEGLPPSFVGADTPGRVAISGITLL